MQKTIEVTQVLLYVAAAICFGFALYYGILVLGGIVNYFYDHPVTLLMAVIALPFIIRRQLKKHR